MTSCWMSQQTQSLTVTLVYPSPWLYRKQLDLLLYTDAVIGGIVYLITFKFKPEFCFTAYTFLFPTLAAITFTNLCPHEDPWCVCTGPALLSKAVAVMAAYCSISACTPCMACVLSTLRLEYAIRSQICVYAPPHT